jgi:hypothetical protein
MKNEEGSSEWYGKSRPEREKEMERKMEMMRKTEMH